MDLKELLKLLTEFPNKHPEEEIVQAYISLFEDGSGILSVEISEGFKGELLEPTTYYKEYKDFCTIEQLIEILK